MSHRIALERALLVGASLASLTLASKAQAQQSQQSQQAYALDLVSGSNAPPEFVCVVHHDALERSQQTRIDDPSVQQFLQADEDRVAFTVKQGTTLPSADADTQAAWKAMQSHGPEAPCGASHPACVARIPPVTTGKTSYLICARNAPWHSRNGKVLIVEESNAGEPRTVERIELAGSIARLELGGAPAPTTPSQFRVAGGHYETAPPEAPIGHRYGMRLIERCQTRQVAVPEAATTDFVEVEISARAPMTTCRRPTAPTLTVEVPPGRTDAQNRLRFTVPAGAKGGSTYEAVWDASLPQKVTLVPRSISFAWQAPCEFSERTCPTAAMPEAGLRCTGELMPPAARKAEPNHPGNLACAYRCEAIGAVTSKVTWPACVVIRADDPALTWTVELAAPGETLHAYVADAKRSFPVRFAWEERSEEFLTRAGDRIRFVELTTPEGLTHRIEPRDGRRVTIPGGRCGDTFDSQVVGDRRYGAATARIEDGWLVIPDAKQSARALQVGGMVGGGFILPASRFGLPGPNGLEARAYGTAQLAFRLQPDPHLESSVFEPRAYELQLSYVIAQQPYFPVHAPDDQVEDQAEYLAFNRWAFEAMPLWQLGQRTQLGVGMGVGLGFPVRTKDEPAVGKSRLFFIPLTTLARIQVSKAVSIEGSFRLVGPEKIYRYEPSPFFAGTPTRSEETLWSGMLGVVGVRVWL